MLGGVALAGLGWSGFLPAFLGLVAMGVGAVVLATDIAGWCLAYTVFGLSTLGAATGALLPLRCWSAHVRESIPNRRFGSCSYNDVCR